jgi:hypothetical protein
MKKLNLDLNALEVQTFAPSEDAVEAWGTVHGRQKQGNTGIQDTDCSAVDACPSARGCTRQPGCNDSAVDACPSSLGCTQINCPAEQ